MSLGVSLKTANAVHGFPSRVRMARSFNRSAMRL